MRGYTLVSSLGTTPAVVLESLSYLEAHLGRLVGRVYIIHTSNQVVMNGARLLREVLEGLGYDVVLVGVGVDDIIDFRTHLEFTRALKSLLSGVEGAIILNVAGGRKTMSAQMVYEAYTHPEASDKIHVIMHILVPRDVESCRSCGFHKLKDLLNNVTRDEGRLREAAERVIQRYREVIKGGHPCDASACPSDGDDLEVLAACMIPCVPPHVVILPGPRPAGMREALYGAAQLAGSPWRELAETVHSVTKPGFSLGEARERAREVFGIFGDPRGLYEHFLDKMDTPWMPERAGGLEALKRFSELQHHARECSHLDGDLQRALGAGGPPATYVWAYAAQGIYLEKGSSRECLAGPHGPEGLPGNRYSYTAVATLSCRSGLTKATLYLTALTSAQAERMVRELREYLKDEGLCP